MQYFLSETWRAFSAIYSNWILWNLFLAVIPLALSYWLYRRKKPTRTFLWWLAFVAFIAFLPNAPYMLTDIIHLIRGARENLSVVVVTLIFIPLHLLAISGGFLAYVISLLNQDIYLKRQGLGGYILITELSVHLLCAIGIYLGRFRRLNSWDIVVDPGNVLLSTLDDLTSKRPVLVIFVTFVILSILYWSVKQIVLGLKLRIQYARAGMDVIK